MLFDHVRKMLLFAGLALLVLAMACGSGDGDTTEPESGGAAPAAQVDQSQSGDTSEEAEGETAPAAQVDQPQSCEDDTLKSGSKSYSAPPPMSIDPNKSYTATFCMEGGGEFTVELFAKEAPNTVNSFVFLAREQFYNGTTFHRVLANFMAQGGDPTGKGTGGPGYRFDNELTPDCGAMTAPALLSMANSGIKQRPRDQRQPVLHHVHPDALPRRLQPGRHSAKDCSEGSCHTVFGRVIEGMDVVNGISLRDPQTARTPGDAIATIIIEESG